MTALRAQKFKLAHPTPENENPAPEEKEVVAPESAVDMDESLRASVNGGVGGFLGRRRLKKIGAQTASLGWRTIVGKISAVVDWRD